VRLIFLYFLLTSAARSGAQTPFSQEDERIFHAGLTVGANFCQVDGDGFSGYHKAGLAANASVFVRLLPFLHANLGIGYSQKGSRESRIQETYIGPAVFRYRLDLNYVEMPFMLHLIEGKGFNYSAGISYARLLSFKEEAEDVNYIKISPELYPFKKRDWVGILGIGYHLGSNWFASGQYQYTLGSIRSEPDIPPGYGFGRQRNNVMTIRLVYIIKSGGER
jgi:hypothetical protein